jgi:hypothetical protein
VGNWELYWDCAVLKKGTIKRSRRERKRERIAKQSSKLTLLATSRPPGS